MSEEIEGPGRVGVDELPGLMRDVFDQCVADARTIADPRRDLSEFIEELWVQMSAAFGLVRREWATDGNRPWPVLLEEQRGFAEAVLEGRLPPGELQP